MYKINIFFIHFFIILYLFFQCPSCKTACTFYYTRGMEENKYETTKLPAPEENEIHMNNYDIAVLMQKNFKGIWEIKNYYYAKQQFTMISGNWIIVITDDGVVKQYRYFVFFNMIFTSILSQKKYQENNFK